MIAAAGFTAADLRVAAQAAHTSDAEDRAEVGAGVAG